MNAMRPATAFAIGLWVGGLAVGTVSLLYGRLGRVGGGEAEAGALAARHAEELRVLQQENARLAAEAQRLTETVAELKAAAPEPPRRRIPFRREPVVADEVAAARQWAAVVESDARAVGELRALFANPFASREALVAAVETLSRPAAGVAADLEGRLGLLAELAERTTNAEVQAAIEAGEGELTRRWMEEPPAAAPE